MELSDWVLAKLYNDAAAQIGEPPVPVPPRLGRKEPLPQRTSTPPPTRERKKRKRQPHAVQRARKAAALEEEIINGGNNDKSATETRPQESSSLVNAPPAGDNAGPSTQSPDGQAAPAKKRRIRRKPIPTSERPQNMRRQAEFALLMEMRAAQAALDAAPSNDS